MTNIEEFSGSGPVRPHYRFDEQALAQWMGDRVDEYKGPLVVEQFKGGQSNPTYRLKTPDRDYVLRRKPTGSLIKGAHAIEREARVMSALGTAGFPVPKIYGSCSDTGIIGSDFFIMQMVEGRIFWESGFRSIPVRERAAYMDLMNATLARLHSLDYVALGLSDYGKQGSYVARQVKRWSLQYLEGQVGGRDPHMEALIDWLPANLPKRDETTLIHGDFRADNLVFHPTEARILAVLDWELSTLGDPISDFAYHLMTYRLPSEVLGGLGGLNLKELALPDEQSYIAAYCRRTDRDNIDYLNYYVAFNMFRFAAILHGIRARVARGTAVSNKARSMGDQFAQVAQLAWEQARVSDTG